jgi:hypothetical protein
MTDMTIDDLVILSLFSVSFCTLAVAISVILVTVQVNDAMIQVRSLVKAIECHFSNDDISTTATHSSPFNDALSTIPLQPYVSEESNEITRSMV